jgi:hypothetical protein
LVLVIEEGGYYDPADNDCLALGMKGTFGRRATVPRGNAPNRWRQDDIPPILHRETIFWVHQSVAGPGQ